MSTRSAVESTLSLLPLDLVAVLTYATVATATVGTGPDGSVWQFLVGAGLVLFAPGYALVAALFPARPRAQSDRTPTSVLALTRPHEGLLLRERLALSFGVSVLLIPLFAVLLGALGIRLTTASTLAAVWTVVGGGVVVAAARRFALPAADRFELRSATGLGGTAQLLGDDSATRLLTVGLCLSAVLALGAFTVAVAGPTQSMSYTSAAVLSPSPGGDLVASGYPENVSEGEAIPLAVRVSNHHESAVDYAVVTRLERVDGGTVRSGDRVWQGDRRLGVNETWTENHTVTPTMAGQDLRLTYYVFRGPVPETVNRSAADKVLYLRIDVFPGDASGGTVRTPTGGDGNTDASTPRTDRP